LRFVVREVSDLDRSLAFYSKVLGMEETRRYTNAGVVEVVMSLGAKDNAFVALARSGGVKVKPVPGTSRIGVAVTDIAKAVGAVAAAGGKIVQPPRRVGRAGEAFSTLVVAVVTDPDGYPIELLQQNRDSAAPLP